MRDNINNLMTGTLYQFPKFKASSSAEPTLCDMGTLRGCTGKEQGAVQFCVAVQFALGIAHSGESRE